MRLIISVVSHFHHDTIINLASLKILKRDPRVVIVCRDNIPTGKLRKYCERYGIIYTCNKSPMGFAANNNANFKYYEEHLEPAPNDFFLMLNPDVILTYNATQRLFEHLSTEKNFLYTVNMYHDREFMSHDDNVRTFPTFWDFFRTYLFNQRATMIDRTAGLADNGASDNYWCSCAFLVLKAKHYKQLRGLNESFYLYCEDIEFCKRALKQGLRIRLLENVRAIHLRRRRSLSFLSNHFRWHFFSVLKYQLSKYRLLPFRSRIKNHV